jgi:uncharacterized protein YgiM (DUF1202 family)
MRKIKVLISLMLLLFAAAAQAEMVQVTGNSICVRQFAGVRSPVVTVLNQGDRVTLLKKVGKWYEIQLPNGVVGYAFHRFFQLASAEAAKAAEAPKLVETNPAAVKLGEVPKVEVDKVAEPPQAIVTPVVSEASKAVETPQPAVEKVAQLRSVEVAKPSSSDVQVKQLQGQLSRQDAEIKSLRLEVTNLTEQLAAEKQGKEQAVAELAGLRESLAAKGNGKLLALADNTGERVFLRGVGEVVMATDSGKTVMKVPASSESKADRILASVRAEKVARNGYLYYVAPSAALSW